MLFRPGFYACFVQEGHHTCQTISQEGAAVMDRMRLKTRIKRMIRGLSTSSGAAPDTTEPTDNE